MKTMIELAIAAALVAWTLWLQFRIRVLEIEQEKEKRPSELTEERLAA